MNLKIMFPSIFFIVLIFLNNSGVNGLVRGDPTETVGDEILLVDMEEEDVVDDDTVDDDAVDDDTVDDDAVDDDTVDDDAVDEEDQNEEAEILAWTADTRPTYVARKDGKIINKYKMPYLKGLYNNCGAHSSCGKCVASKYCSWCAVPVAKSKSWLGKIKDPERNEKLKKTGKAKSFHCFSLKSKTCPIFQANNNENNQCLQLGKKMHTLVEKKPTTNFSEMLNVIMEE